MTQLKRNLAQRFASVVGIATIASLAALPSFAQTTRPEDPRVSTPEDRSADSVEGREQRTPDMSGSETPSMGEQMDERVSPSDRTSQEQVSPTDRAAASELDQEFVKLAYQGNNAEIQTSQLALERSQDQRIRDYAQRMVTEHTRANEALSRYARENNIELPSERVDPFNQALAERLGSLSGAEFNQAYVEAQTNAHLRAIALYRTELSQGQLQGLKTYASQTLPRVQEHYEMASAMAPNYASDTTRPNVDVEPLQ